MIGAHPNTWLPSPDEIGAIALGEGIEVQASEDLNNLLAYGNYKCVNQNIVSTLKNCPTKQAFRMEVGSSAPGVNNYYYQKITSITGLIYYRSTRYSNGEMTWRDWISYYSDNNKPPIPYSSLEQIELSDANFETGNIMDHLLLIYNKLPVASELWVTTYTTVLPNLWASIKNQINNDLNNLIGDKTPLNLVFKRTHYLLEIYASPQAIGSQLYGLRFECVYRYSTVTQDDIQTVASYLSPFSITRGNNIIWLKDFQRHGYFTDNGIVLLEGSVPTTAGTSEETGVTLDTVAWHGLTYRQIFEESNLLGDLSFENPLPPTRWKTLKNNSDTDSTVEITEEVAAVGTHSLKIVSSGYAGGTISAGTKEASCLYSDKTFQVTVGDMYYSSAMIRVDEYEDDSVNSKGWCGLGVVGNFLVGFRRTTEGFEQASRLITLTETHYPDGIGSATNYIGYCATASSDGQHNARCYIDTPVLLRVDALWDKDNRPSSNQLDILYSNYIAILSNRIITPIFYNVESISSYVSNNNNNNNNSGLNKFIEMMNQKGKELGMNNTVFVNPSGIMEGTNRNSTTARDMAKLGVVACSNNILLDIWSKRSQTLEVRGSNNRQVNISQAVNFTSLNAEQECVVLGAKGGSWISDGHAWYSLLALSKCHDALIITFIASSESNLIPATKELLTLVNLKLSDDIDISMSTLENNVESAIAYQVPNYIAAYSHDFQPSSLYEYNADIEWNPASTTKVMTALLALEYAPDVHNTFVTVKSSDDVGYSGANLYLGEKLSLYDALCDTLLPSSNIAATCVGRTVGERILDFNY